MGSVCSRNGDEREIGGWVILKWIALIWFRTGTGGGSCEHGDEPSGSVRWLLKEDSALQARERHTEDQQSIDRTDCTRHVL
jgi:hypothetical protein